MPTHSLLTPNLAARVVSRVARGIPRETVARQLSLSPSIISVWAHRTEHGQWDNPLAVRLVRALAHADAHAEWHRLRVVDTIAEQAGHRDQLKAATWRLERSPQTRDRYGLKVQMQHTTTPASLADQQVQALSTSELEALVEGDYRELPPGAPTP